MVYDGIGGIAPERERAMKRVRVVKAAQHPSTMSLGEARREAELMELEAWESSGEFGWKHLPAERVMTVFRLRDDHPRQTPQCYGVSHEDWLDF
jgi:hypothetical protein